MLVRPESLNIFSNDFRGDSVLESWGSRKYFRSSKRASIFLVVFDIFRGGLSFPPRRPIQIMVPRSDWSDFND